MSEEQITPAPEEDTQAEAEPTTEQEQSAVDWEKRYGDLQPEYTRATQEAAQLRQELDALRNDPEKQKAFLAELGLELEEEPEIETDQLAALRKEIETLKGTFQETTTKAEEARQKQAWEAHQSTVFQTLGDGRGTPITDREAKAIRGIAFQMDPLENGFPPLEAAYQEWLELENEAQGRWKKTKRTTHHVSPNGGTGTKQHDLSTHEGRVAAAMAKLNDD